MTLTTAGRTRGASTDSPWEEWISYIKKIKLEMEAHDEDVVISAKQMASKMLRWIWTPL